MTFSRTGGRGEKSAVGASNGLSGMDMPPMLRLNVDMKSSGRSREVSIGELAAHFGLATHVLRHWESMGLLAPRRTPTGQRTYRLADQFRVAAILQAKQAGMGLDDIRAILTASNPTDRTAVLRHQHDELTRRIADARAALDLVEAGLNCEHGDLATCPHFQSLLAERVGHR